VIEEFTTYTSRHYGTVVRLATAAAGFIIERSDGVGEVFVPVAEAQKAGVALQIGDRIEMQVVRGRARNVMLDARNGRRHRVLPAD
jgi:cold shock CspA family protein